MTSGPSDRASGDDWPAEIDTATPHAARIYDYYLGGGTNFEVDRIAAEHAAAVHPGELETVRASVRSNRAFLIRAVTWLAGEAGVRQFLDIGSGIPNGDNVHTAAQRINPATRTVYVDNDPIVLPTPTRSSTAHARAPSTTCKPICATRRTSCIGPSEPSILPSPSQCC